MVVGLEAGLTIDAMADELAKILDRADEASLSGDIDERLLFMRPFIPDKANALPVNWKAILRSWVSGDDITKIGPQNIRAVEEAFTYRLVWALEAVRTRRMSLGWSPETVAGGGAAAVETGVPQFMMSMLIRAGLPSRRAAMAAIEDAKPVFATPAEMRAWLESDEITAYAGAGDWPTPGTAALWARFRTGALSGGIQKWSGEHYKRLLDIAAAPPAGLYRIVTDAGDERTWLSMPRLPTSRCLQEAGRRFQAQPLLGPATWQHQTGGSLACRLRRVALAAGRSVDSMPSIGPLLCDPDRVRKLTAKAETFLPITDASTTGKKVWMLPELQSLTNIYARLNQSRPVSLDGVQLVHDEQIQYAKVLEDFKALMEQLADEAVVPIVPFADYRLRGRGDLIFATGKIEPCAQAADILAGCAMRFARDGQARKGRVDAPLRAAFDQMINAGNSIQATGINLVMSTCLLETLGVPNIPADIVERMFPQG